MIELKALFILFNIFQLGCGIGLKSGPVGNFDIIELRECKCPNGCKGALNINIAKDGNTKSLAGKLTFPSDFDKSYTFNLTSDRWSGSEWKKDYMKMSGPVCQNVNKVAPNILKAFMSQLSPKVAADKCFAPAGSYTFEKVQSKASDVKLPLMYSKYRGTVMLNKGTDEISCMEGIVIIEQ